jgi:hypothetical protein
MKKSIVFEQELRFSCNYEKKISYWSNLKIYTEVGCSIYCIIYRNLLALRKRRRYHFPYTVTKATQNEATLWKIAVLGREKPHVGAGTYFPSPILAFYIPPCRKSILASEAGPSAVLMQEDSVKTSK